ncbi:MAG: hypothetical protein DRN30_06975 [Thermoplasmata archaeon]|nr:MAG: hypothetical protein DRN30_06975 [Thermoplasmata archaeon]
MPSDAEEWVERIKKELNEYAIGDYDLDQVFEPLLVACSKVARTYNEFKQCVNEGISTLKSVVSRVKL